MLRPESISAAVGARRARQSEAHPTPRGKQLGGQATRAPMIFADSAVIDDIRPLLAAGIIHGVTTNPTLLKRAGAATWSDAKTIMRDICRELHPGPVSLELTELTPEAMIRQAEELVALGDNAVIKVPIGGYRAINPEYDPYTGLKVIRALWEREIKVNCTLVFNSTQAMWAAMAGAVYVSPFLGRVADYLYKNDAPAGEPGNSLYSLADTAEPVEEGMAANTEYVASGGLRRDAGTRLIHEIVQIFANYDVQAQVLASSFRNAAQISECLLAGADILTVPAKILATVADHPLSDLGMKSFAADAGAFEG